jgi:hypothetical protein
MRTSAQQIDATQATWAADRPRDTRWVQYLQTTRANLFLAETPAGLSAASHADFTKGDGAELQDSKSRPAKMRALASSSALAANFFDAWRDAEKGALTKALALPSAIASLRFEYKPQGYPVRPRSPNLDLLLVLADGIGIGVESKFSEPYRSTDGWSGLAARYFPASDPLWESVDMPGAQRVAERFRPDWIHLDVPQLLKHLLGLASDPTRPSILLYLWFDTGLPDARDHQAEIDRFGDDISGGSVQFRAISYQQVFARIGREDEPVPGWHDYMRARYFPNAAV